jgi:hypothetical protein
MPWFAVPTGTWGAAMVVLLIFSVRLSYRIEARSEGLRNRSGIPRKAMVFHTITNWKVARDPETQAMRRRMNRLFLCILAGFVAMPLLLGMMGKA